MFFFMNMLQLGECDYLNNYFEITQIIVFNLFFWIVKKVTSSDLKTGKKC